MQERFGGALNQYCIQLDDHNRKHELPHDDVLRHEGQLGGGINKKYNAGRWEKFAC